MLREILTTRVPETNPQPDTPVMTIEYIDARIDLKVRVNVFDGYVSNGAAYLVVQPIAQLIGGKWMPVTCDDTAFPVDCGVMVGIEQVS